MGSVRVAVQMGGENYDVETEWPESLSSSVRATDAMVDEVVARVKRAYHPAPVEGADHAE